ncbi:Gfo/Idh/MocA family protein [Phycisphaera mikurensis]|uniref:Putative oxidoreductase n=1 Tax=Phycisphaera mikurensis (strain NBRC 102666 / KCTC 22515 / FYK2301M01) TaxID=1142394 RepID=I0IEJ2_PHYMF|nr:Gfo/Idh/MocA family oxidoreductase [Phycisphaera mikurensis]MBB6441479.1 putative dehydrogenase [Phycisphaera mikurensis]BAM03680.1 putative oxidoreductase [Phycisphaera mikurensis NBRC 102666]
MIRYGIIGTGGMASGHAERTGKIEGVEMAACCDIDAERSAAFAEKHGFAASVTAYEDLLERCDAVAIVTPDKFHAPLTLQGLAAGKHVMCEKPLTTTFADAKEVASAARKAHDAGQVTFINFTYRNSAAWQEARRMIADGAIGEVRHATGRYLQAWLAAKVWGSWTQEQWLWRCETPKNPDGTPVGPAAGGVLADVGCHILDFITGLTGPASSLRCTAKSFPNVDPDTGERHTTYQGRTLDANSSVSVELDLDGGGLALAQATRWASGHPNQVALGVYGTEGAIEIDLEDSWTKLRHCLGEARHRSGWTAVDLAKTPTNYDRFIASIATGEQDQADILRGAKIQAYLEACDLSVQADGARTPVPSLGL